MSRALLSVSMVLGLGFALLVSPAGCNNDGSLKPCKLRSDCSDGYSCVNGLCHKTCAKDADCEATGEKCEDSFCGGRRKREKVTQDGGPTPVCTPGDSEKCYDGAQGTEGTGICKAGTKVCNDDGQWGECKGQVVPKKFEDCNQKDDNCNGKVDENCGTSCNLGDTRECYTGPDSTKNVGPCKAGKETCEKGSDGKPAWGQCVGQVLPSPPENCNNDADDDCNGKVNDGCSCKTTDKPRPCKADNGCAGIQTCQVKGGGTEWSQCIAGKTKPEECNGLDDDCDGKTDEDENGKTLQRKCKPTCFEGIEVCKNGDYRDCDAKIPTDELCNNIDDDCDGKIDNIKNKEDPLLKGCPTGKPGLCKTGRMFCEKGQWGKCNTPEPQQENCNDLDDDCDGKTDEDEDKPCGDGQKCIKDTVGNKKCIPA